MSSCSFKKRSVPPGFGLALGYTVVYLSLLVLIPLAATFLKASSLTWDQFWHIAASPRALASYRLTFGASPVGAVINLFFGVLVAWVLVRYTFPGKRLFDSLVDLPFALPTAVAGIALTTIYAPNGWLGRPLASLGIKSAYTPLGVAIALTFIGLPFVVRSVQPVLRRHGQRTRGSCGEPGRHPLANFFASRACRRFCPLPWRVSPWRLRAPSANTARWCFISGNMPMKTEITPLLIITKLDQYDYAGATAIAVVMLVFSLILLLPINLLQKWSSSREEKIDRAGTEEIQ